ncbi:hypothetical protein MMC07_003676 [Pseudocyphellaria aurata]|nr:hypothetical protein [Pseudocyphellaria aurata]
MLVVNEEKNSTNDNHHHKPNLPSPHSTSSFWHSHPSPFLYHHRTTATLPAGADVVIIGSGISGAFAARALAQEESVSVLMLEARDACWGATGRNGGHCQPLLYGHSADVAAFELRNFQAISSLVREHDIACEWEVMEGGGCHAFFSERSFEEAKGKAEELRKSNADLGALIEVVSDNLELANLKIPNAVGAIVQTHAAKLSPYKLVSWILESLIKQSNLNLQTCTPVLRISLSGCVLRKWTVHTARGTIQTPHVLFATNAYTGRLLPQFRDLVVPVRGQMSALTPTEILLRKPLTHTYSFVGVDSQNVIHDDYLIQRPVSSASGDEGQLMFGGGRSIARNGGIYVDNDDGIDELVANYLRSKLENFLNIGFDEPVASSVGSTPSQENRNGLKAEKEWTGIMGYSRDGFPWVGAVPDMTGLWISAGFTSHGMPNAALSAHHVGCLIIASFKGGRWREHEQNAVRDGDMPFCYISSRERISRADKLPMVDQIGTLAGC